MEYRSAAAGNEAACLQAGRRAKSSDGRSLLRPTPAQRCITSGGASGRPDHPHHEYVCSGYRHYSKSCTCHYIRVEVVEQLILDAIRRASRYAIENEAAFIQRVREEAALRQEAAVRESRRKLTKGKRRREEISRLIKKLYESYAADKIPENHFSELLAGYDAEQKSLDAELERLQSQRSAATTPTA